MQNQFFLHFSNVQEEMEIQLKNRGQTDNKQTQRCKKLKIRPKPTKVSHQLTKMTGG